MLKICISGLGRTGTHLARFLLKCEKAAVVSALCSPGSSKAGRDLGELLGLAETGIPVYSSENLEACIFNTKPDVVIDFSDPVAALKNAEKISKCKVRLVMGTTGFRKEDEGRLFAVVRKNQSGMIYAPNITRGVNTLMFLTGLAAKILGSYDIEIVEMHHSRKLDSPSGTAKKLANELKASRTGAGEIPISSVRAGGIVGSHTVLLAGENDMIEITHQSFSRDAFAEGALYAAEFISKKTGVFEMKDAMNTRRILEEALLFELADSMEEQAAEL